MIDEQHIDLVTAYLQGTISSEEREKLNHLIDEGEIDILDIKEMEMLYKKMGNIPAEQPSENMREQFYLMLEEEKSKQQTPITNQVSGWIQKMADRLEPKQLAYAACIVIGMLIGNWATPFSNYNNQLDSLSSEVSQMREVMMLSLLDNSSPTERLKAVNISSEIKSADQQIVDALLKTLNNDSNVNVRLATIEALINHESDPRVREGLVNSIAMQESPLVQSALADAMIILQEKRSVDEFKRLLERNGLDTGVRDKLENTIAALS